jgi:hypothetical protein
MSVVEGSQMGNENVERLPVKVPVDAPFEEIVRAYKRLWAIANPRSIGNVILAVEDMRPDLALRLVDDFRYDGPGVLFTSSLSGRGIKQPPREVAERQARHLVELLERMGWREAGSAPPPPPEPERLAAARRIAEKARQMDPADWPGWSTSEQIVAALAAARPDELPASYRDPGEAWTRLDDDQRAAVREANPDMARFCKASADHAD